MKLARISLSGKIVSLVLFVVAAVGGSTFGAAYYYSSKSFDEQAEERIDLSAAGVQGVLDDMKENLKAHAISFANRQDIIEAIKDKNMARLRQLAGEVLTSNHLDVLTIADARGNVLARGHSDKIGDSVLNQTNIKKALAGEASVGIEEGTEVKFSLRAGAPVKVDGSIVGTITPGIDLTATNAFVDGMKKRFNVECTVFHDDTRVSTTLEKDGKRLSGTKMDNPRVIDTVLGKGQKFLNINTIQGKTYNTVYWPIIGAEGKISGMLFLGSDRSIIERACRKVISAVLEWILIVGACMCAVGYFLAGSFVRPMLKRINLLNESAAEVSAATVEVLTSSRQLAEGASEQAASVEETSASLDEMYSMTRQNAENANLANGLMKETRETVSTAGRTMGELTASMGEISKASEETSRIVKTIDEIAFKTNLLALNAAVEAARAGEAGAGFAVVADEVRNLAMRSAEAARNTADLIEGTVRKIKEGCGLVEKTDEEFRKVSVSVEKSSGLVDEISAASKEQTEGIKQIHRAVDQIDKVIQQNSSNAEQSASTSGQMNNRAEEMKELVNGLVSLVGGSRGKTALSESSPVKSKG